MASPHARPFALLLAVSLVLLGCDSGSSSPLTEEPPPAGQPPAEDAVDVERRMERHILELVNEERQARDLEPLTWDDQLAELARDWSAGMAERGSLEHQDPEVMLDRSEGFVGVGENIFRSTAPVPASTVHVGWMRSDEHRVNVLGSDFDRLGVGIVCTEDGQVYATQRFGVTGPLPTERPHREVPPPAPVVASEGEGPACPAGG